MKLQKNRFYYIQCPKIKYKSLKICPFFIFFFSPRAHTTVSLGYALPLARSIIFPFVSQENEGKESRKMLRDEPYSSSILLISFSFPAVVSWKTNGRRLSFIRCHIFFDFRFGPCMFLYWYLISCLGADEL